jgi:outer membrane protein OmpA-like peptidoglycan-associated protein
MKKVFVTGALVMLAVGSSACASKKYVNTRVAEVNDKVTGLSRSVEETQERVRQNEKRITEVDEKADTISQKADAAGRAAADARNAADAAGKKADEIDAASRKLVYEVVLSEDKARFDRGKAMLTDEAKVELDALVDTLESDPRNVYLEIEGHTDSTGEAAFNEQLGIERAESVKRYLYESHNIPLHKMNVISYGETKPIAPNKTRDGRAQNRRVVVRVVA